MRVLHIGKYFPPHRGGMETVLRDQMNMQARDEGLQVSAIVHSSERRLKDKIEIRPEGYRVRYAARWFTALFAPIAPFFAWSVYREIKATNPDEIKIHMPNVSAFWLLLLPAARRCRWVVLWHSDVLPTRHNWAFKVAYIFYRQLEVRVLRHCAGVLATSPQYLASSQPLQAFSEKCEVEPLKIDTTRIPQSFLEAPQPPKQKGEGLRVLCVGRLTYYKDFQTAIAAVAKIPDAHLHIIGEGEERGNLESIIRDLRVERRVKLLGDVADEVVWQEFVWTDVNVLPSKERTEAFGLVILEAACFGKPTIVADTPGSGMQWVAQTISPRGTLFKSGTAESLAQQ